MAVGPLIFFFFFRRRDFWSCVFVLEGVCVGEMERMCVCLHSEYTGTDDGLVLDVVVSLTRPVAS